MMKKTNPLLKMSASAAFIASTFSIIHPAHATEMYNTQLFAASTPFMVKVANTTPDTGTVTPEAVTGTVNLIYRNIYNNEIIYEETFQGDLATLETSLSYYPSTDFRNYTLQDGTEPVSINISEENPTQTITYYYKPLRGYVIVNINGTTAWKSIALNEDFHNNSSGQSVEINYYDIGEMLMSYNSSLDGTGSQFVTFKKDDPLVGGDYVQNVSFSTKEGNLHVLHLTEDGKIIEGSVSELSEGANTLEPKDYEQFEVVSSSLEIDADGEEVSPPIPLMPPETTSDNYNVQFNVGAEDLTNRFTAKFIYRKVLGNLKVNYVDELGNFILPSKSISNLNLGSYTEDAPAITNYSLVSATTQNVQLSKANRDQEITFVYRIVSSGGYYTPVVIDTPPSENEPTPPINNSPEDTEPVPNVEMPGGDLPSTSEIISSIDTKPVKEENPEIDETAIINNPKDSKPRVDNVSVSTTQQAVKGGNVIGVPKTGDMPIQTNYFIAMLFTIVSYLGFKKLKKSESEQ